MSFRYHPILTFVVILTAATNCGLRELIAGNDETADNVTVISPRNTEPVAPAPVAVPAPAPAPAPTPPAAAVEAPPPTPVPPQAPPSTPASTPLPVRRFLLVTGSVQSNGKKVQVHDEIPAEAQIETGANGYAIITLMPNSIVEIRANSKLVIGKSPRKNISVKLRLGAVWSFIASGGSYEVVTPNAVAGVRGTAFFVDVKNGKGPTYLCDCDGEIEVRAFGADVPFETITTKGKHKSHLIVGKGIQPTLKAAPLEEHDDAAAAALAPFLRQTQ